MLEPIQKKSQYSTNLGGLKKFEMNCKWRQAEFPTTRRKSVECLSLRQDIICIAQRQDCKYIHYHRNTKYFQHYHALITREVEIIQWMTWLYFFMKGY